MLHFQIILHIFSITSFSIVTVNCDKTIGCIFFPSHLIFCSPFEISSCIFCWILNEMLPSFRKLFHAVAMSNWFFQEKKKRKIKETHIFIKSYSKQNFQWYYYTDLCGRFQNKGSSFLVKEPFSVLHYANLLKDQWNYLNRCILGIIHILIKHFSSVFFFLNWRFYCADLLK